MNKMEVQLEVKETQIDLARELALKAFAEGPKLLGVTIMEGDSKVGLNWNESH